MCVSVYVQSQCCVCRAVSCRFLYSVCVFARCSGVFVLRPEAFAPPGGCGGLCVGKWFLSVACISNNFAQSMLQKSCCRLLTVLRLTIGFFFFFCVCSSPLTLPSCQLPLPHPLDPHLLFASPLLFLFFCSFFPRCFAAQLGPTFRACPRLRSRSGPCDDCVLYQSVTCVLAQPPPVPCTRRGDPCAVAASTDRRAA